jgi:thymidylate kinase
MILILEGVDCAGKTWMAERLLKEMPNAYLIKHGNRPKENSAAASHMLYKNYKAMLDTYELAIKHSGGTLIFDRFYMSELIYGPVTRGYNLLTDKYQEELENRLKQNDHLYVEITATKENIIERMKSRGEYYLKLEKLDPIMVGYEEFYDQTTLNRSRVGSGDNMVDFLINERMNND